jgi:hypothetical protein
MTVALAEPRVFSNPFEDREAEAAVIGVLLNLPGEVLSRVGFLEPADFRHPLHALVLAHARHIAERGELPTIKALYHRLRSDDLQLDRSSEQIGQDLDGLAYAYSATLPDDAERYARVVANLGRRRRFVEQAREAIYRAELEPDTDVTELLRELGNAGVIRTPSDLPPITMLEDCRLDTEMFWAIEDILPRCNMMMVYARGGSGKTYLGSSIALGIGAGRWFDHEAERGGVLICAFERPEDTEDRIAALRDRLALHDLPVALLKLGGKRLDDQAADLIVTRAKELADRTSMPVRAIEIDTVSAALAGSKEDDEGLGRLRMIGERIHAETGALVIWIHHEGKGDHMGPRGHLSLADGCMVWWHVEEREDGSRVVHVSKANRGPAHVPLFAFNLLPFEAGRDRRNKPIQLCELQRVDLEVALASPVRKRFGQAPADPDAKLGSRQKLMLRLLEKLVAKHPSGVERATLRSHFILELNAERERKGQPALAAERARCAFRQTLSKLQDRIDEADGLLSLSV